MANLKNLNQPFAGTKFGQDIYAKRQAHGLSTRAAAEQCGITSSTFNRCEFGKNPDFDSLVKLCNWLGRTIQYYFTNN